MSNNDNHQEKIINYIDFIKKHPRELKYFSFDEGRRFIVDGNKIKMLPIEYSKYYNRDEFYICVDPDQKKIIYYAFDVVNYTSNEHTNDSLGYFDWDKVSNQVYAFLTLHLKELTTSSTPYHDVVEKKGGSTSSGSQAMTRYRSDSDFPNAGRGFGERTTTTTTSSSYSFSSYKERDAFCTKITDYLKENKTSIAIDHINNHIKKMCEEKKFDDLDYILRWITFDKLNIPTMIAFLDTTRGADHLLKERKDFYGKVKGHLMKIKPTLAGHILRNLEPGKEYKNVVKYEAK
jgi:hypothetical protein